MQIAKTENSITPRQGMRCWVPIYLYEASITAQGLYPNLHPYGVVYIGYQNSWTCNWGMQIDWWLQPRAVFGHTFSGIIWQKWSQFNCMTIVMASSWDRASLMYITFGITLIYYIVLCVVDSASQIFATLYMIKTGVLYGQQSSQERLPENRNSFQNYVACLQNQVFSGLILPEHTFKEPYMGHRWNTETAITIHEPFTRIRRLPVSI